jgi:hypothetical protein
VKQTRQSTFFRVLNLAQELSTNMSSWGVFGEVFVHGVRRPRHAVHWIEASLGRKTPLEMGLPYLAWPCIDFLRKFCQPDSRVFEYGGGGSTIFFANLGCHVTTIEGNTDWVCAIRDRLLPARHRVEIRHVSTDEEHCSEYAHQVHDGGPWDLILVDGAFRLDCLREAKSELTDGGVLILDNADEPQYAEAPLLLPVFERYVCRGLGVARRRVTQTDVYIPEGRSAGVFQKIAYHLHRLR